MGEQVQLLLTRSAFLALEDEWNTLAEGASLTLQFDWLIAVEELDPTEALRVVTVRRGGMLVAATALVEPRGPEPRLEPLGHYASDASAAVLALDAAARATLLRAMARLHRLQQTCWPARGHGAALQAHAA